MIRLYGHSLGEGSFAQVTRGMLRALKAHGSLAGFLPVDDLQKDLEFEGADAPVALNCGAPSMAALPLTVGQHKHRWLLLAPNSNGVPKAIQTLLVPCKLTGLLAPSQWAVEVLQREFPGMPVLLAEHGVTPEIHHPDANEHTQRVLAYRYDEMRVLHVSSTLGERKGTKDLLRAWSRLRAEKKLPKRATLHVVVHPLASSECGYLARGDDSIVVRPATTMPPKVFTSILRAAHLVVQPSRSEGFGLCLKKGTLITTGSGTKPIECVERGELVVARDGQWTKVTATSSRNGKHIVRIKANGMPDLLVTPTHRILVAERGSEPAFKFRPVLGWRKARELRKGFYLLAMPRPVSENGPVTLRFVDFARAPIMDDAGRFTSRYSNRSHGSITARDVAAAAGVSIHSVRHALQPSAKGLRQNKQVRERIVDAAHKMKYFEHQRVWMPAEAHFTPELAHLLGYYAAEGSISGGFVQFSFHPTKDEIPVQQVRAGLSQLGLTCGQYIKKNGALGLNLNCSSSILVRAMSAWCGKGAKNKRLPEWIFSSSRGCRAAALEALQRGDGHNDFGHMDFVSMSETLAFQVRDLWMSLGIPASIHTRMLRARRKNSLTRLRVHGELVRSKKVAWEVSVTGKWYEPACELIGMQPRRKNKTSRRGSEFIPHAGGWLVPVISVTRERTMLTVHDLQVDRTESFVANGVVVHNCPLEALCCGTPIVATACTGHSAYLYDAVPGFVRVEHGPNAPIDDFPGATAPTVSEDAIADALVLAIGNWLALASDALACAPALSAAWTWEKRNAMAISEMIEMSK